MMSQLYCNKCGVTLENFEHFYQHIYHSNIQDHVFHCSVCKGTYGWKTVTEFNSHVEGSCGIVKLEHAEKENVSITPRYFCERCRKPFGLFSELLNHYKCDHLKHPIACPCCCYRDANIHNMMWHYTKHLVDDKSVMLCLTCCVVFFSAFVYKKHCEIYHQNLLVYKCMLCPSKSFPMPRGINKHIFRYHKDLAIQIHKPFYKLHAQQNNQTMLTKRFQKKIVIKHPNIYKKVNVLPLLKVDQSPNPVTENRSVYCEICNNRFYDFMRYSNHVKLLHSACRYACDQCTKSYVDVKVLIEHYGTKHFNMHWPPKYKRTPIHCNACGEGFPNILRQLKHIKQNHFTNYLQCPFCTTSFRFAQDLVTHISSGHNSKQTEMFYCPFCFKEFFFVEVFIGHFNALHSVLHDKKKFKIVTCNFCSQVFDSYSALICHLKIYINNVYHCFICEKVEGSVADLMKHLKHFHSNAILKLYRPYLLSNDENSFDTGVVSVQKQLESDERQTIVATQQCSNLDTVHLQTPVPQESVGEEGKKLTSDCVDENVSLSANKSTLTRINTGEIKEMINLAAYCSSVKLNTVNLRVPPVPSKTTAVLEKDQQKRQQPIRNQKQWRNFFKYISLTTNKPKVKTTSTDEIKERRKGTIFDNEMADSAASYAGNDLDTVNLQASTTLESTIVLKKTKYNKKLTSNRCLVPPTTDKPILNSISTDGVKEECMESKFDDEMMNLAVPSAWTKLNTVYLPPATPLESTIVLEKDKCNKKLTSISSTEKYSLTVNKPILNKSRTGKKSRFESIFDDEIHSATSSSSSKLDIVYLPPANPPESTTLLQKEKYNKKLTSNRCLVPPTTDKPILNSISTDGFKEECVESKFDDEMMNLAVPSAWTKLNTVYLPPATPLESTIVLEKDKCNKKLTSISSTEKYSLTVNKPILNKSRTGKKSRFESIFDDEMMYSATSSSSTSKPESTIVLQKKKYNKTLTREILSLTVKKPILHGISTGQNKTTRIESTFDDEMMNSAASCSSRSRQLDTVSLLAAAESSIRSEKQSTSEVKNKRKESIVDDEMMNLLSSIETENFDTILDASDVWDIADGNISGEDTGIADHSNQDMYHYLNLDLTGDNKRKPPAKSNFSSITFDEELLKEYRSTTNVKQTRAFCEEREFSRDLDIPFRNKDNPDVVIVDVTCDVCGQTITHGTLNQHFCPGPF